MEVHQPSFEESALSTVEVEKMGEVTFWLSVTSEREYNSVPMKRRKMAAKL
jgi:hypothetical protein